MDLHPFLHYFKGCGISLAEKPDSITGYGPYSFIKSITFSKSGEVLLELEELTETKRCDLDNFKKASNNLNILYGLEFLVVNNGNVENKMDIIPLNEYNFK